MKVWNREVEAQEALISQSHEHRVQNDPTLFLAVATARLDVMVQKRNAFGWCWFK